MHNIIQLAFQVDKLRDIMFNKLKLLAFYVGYIVYRAGDEVIHTDDLMAFIQKVFA